MKNIISDNLKADALYENWITDMAEVCKIFCDLEKIDAVSFWLGTKRGCRRYHIDNVPKRLLVTYAGKGTEWIPNDAADRIAIPTLGSGVNGQNNLYTEGNLQLGFFSRRDFLANTPQTSFAAVVQPGAERAIAYTAGAGWEGVDGGLASGIQSGLTTQFARL